MLSLPNEILFKVANEAGKATEAVLPLVCKQFNEVINRTIYWKPLCALHLSNGKIIKKKVKELFGYELYFSILDDENNIKYYTYDGYEISDNASGEKELYCSHGRHMTIGPDNKVYSWGINSNGELGLDDLGVIQSPTFIGYEGIHVSAGRKRSMLVTKDYKCIVFENHEIKVLKDKVLKVAVGANSYVTYSYH